MNIQKRAVILTLALTLGAVSAAPALAEEVVVTPEAREKFRAGVALIKDPDGARYEEAYVAFKAAYAISPSPNMLGNLGLCALKLERDGEAIVAYTTYLEKGSGIAEEERKQIETDLATMKSTLATVELEVTPAGATAVDERQRSNGTSMRNKYPLAAGMQKLGLRAGTHKITVALEGYVDQTVDVELAPGQVLKKTIVLEKPKEAPAGGGTPPVGGQPDGQPPGGGTQEMERPVPASVWAMLGVTGALAIGAGVTGGLALANKSDFDEANNGSDPANAQSLRDTGQALNITTDVLIGTAVASGAVTLILFFTRPEVPVAAPTGTGVVVFGHF